MSNAALHRRQDVHDVPTMAFRTTQALGRLTLDNRSIMAVYGPAGAGKTYATRHLLDTLHRDDPALQTAWVEMPHNPRGKALPVALLRELTGVRHDGPEYQLVDDVVELISARPTLLVIDEADHLRTHGLHTVRHVYDVANAQTPEPNVAVILVGGVPLMKVLSSDQQLHSRVACRAEFTRLEGQRLFDTLDALHPLLCNSDRDVLANIDDRVCRGSFRNWAQALTILLAQIDAMTEARRPDRISRQLAEAVIHAMNPAPVTADVA